MTPTWNLEHRHNSWCIYMGKLGSELLSVLIKHRAIWRMNCPVLTLSCSGGWGSRLQPNSAQLLLASHSLMCVRKTPSCERSCGQMVCPSLRAGPSLCWEPPDFVPCGSPLKSRPVGGSHGCGSLGQEGSCQPTLCHHQLSAALLGDT